MKALPPDVAMAVATTLTLLLLVLQLGFDPAALLLDP